jgi:hypothetical protein
MYRSTDPAEALAIATRVIEMLFERKHVIGFVGVLDVATEDSPRTQVPTQPAARSGTSSRSSRHTTCWRR